MSGRSLAKRLGKSETYARQRLNNTFEFTLNDVEEFCLFIGVNPEDFISRIEMEAAFKTAFEADEKEYEASRTDIPFKAKTLREVLDAPDDEVVDDGPIFNVGGDQDDLIHLEEPDLRHRYRLAAGTDKSADRIDPETQ